MLRLSRGMRTPEVEFDFFLRMRCELMANRQERAGPWKKPSRLSKKRLKVPGVSLGILVSTHPDMMAAFAANDTFQKTEAGTAICCQPFFGLLLGLRPTSTRLGTTTCGSFITTIDKSNVRDQFGVADAIST
jgi:hypothetical protein